MEINDTLDRIEFGSVDLEQMQEIANAISFGLTAPCTVFLEGTLGAGKTTLVSMIGDHLQLKKGELVKSPSFAIVNSYERQGNLGKIHHFDFYRLTDFDSLEEEIGVSDYRQSDDILFIEWAHKLGQLPFASNLTFYLKYNGHDARKIVIEGEKSRIDKIRLNLTSNY